MENTTSTAIQLLSPGAGETPAVPGSTLSFNPAFLYERPRNPHISGAMQSLLIVFQLFVSIALIGAVLLQRSEGGALGMGGGGSGLGGLFSPRGAADTLTRTTAILAILFFVTSLALTLFSLHGRPQSFLDTNPAGPMRTAPLQHAPARPGPAVPTPHS